MGRPVRTYARRESRQRQRAAPPRLLWSSDSDLGLPADDTFDRLLNDSGTAAHQLIVSVDGRKPAKDCDVTRQVFDHLRNSSLLCSTPRVDKTVASVAPEDISPIHYSHRPEQSVDIFEEVSFSPELASSTSSKEQGSFEILKRLVDQQLTCDKYFETTNEDEVSVVVVDDSDDENDEERDQVAPLPVRRSTRIFTRDNPAVHRTGKGFRRSISVLKNASGLLDVTADSTRGTASSLYRRNTLNPSIFNSRCSVSSRKSVARIIKEDETICKESVDGTLSVTILPDGRRCKEEAYTAVLCRCGQTRPLPFDECYPESELLQHCRKIGEGVFGEVFMRKDPLNPRAPIVMKIIPVEGQLTVNGESQKTYEEVVAELLIAMELSDLRNCQHNSTSTFNKVTKARLVQGQYPSRLLDLWDLYDETKGSENDRPSEFQDDQLYIVLELENGGTDLVSFVFNDAEQTYSLFYQIAYALAVAEEAYRFEHRDLHWGNVLVSFTDEEYIDYTLRGTTHSLRTAGVNANIIDFTLSRMTLPRSACTLYFDIAEDEDLFNANGDYQFEIYRLMRKKNCNEWSHFEPYTNVLWLDYILSKMISGISYSKPKTKVHSRYMSRLKKIKSKILGYGSCVEFVTQEEFMF